MDSASPFDFSAALARLLSDARLRARFQHHPIDVARELNLAETDSQAFAALRWEDIETQAIILLRKRFHAAHVWIPVTVRALGNEAWTQFRDYSLRDWPRSSNPALEDAAGFLDHLSKNPIATVDPCERNRVQFAHDNALIRIHWCRDWRHRSQRRPALQVLLRTSRESQPREYFLYLCLT